MVKFLKNSVKPIDKSKVSIVGGNFDLKVVQQPVKARVAGRKQTRNSSRRLVDPQPVVEIRLKENINIDNNVVDHCLSMFFVRASIECIGTNDKASFFQKQRKSRFYENTEDDEEVLRGTTTVSAQFYRGSPYIACAVFDNLSVRYKGNYRLKFELFEIQSFSQAGSIIPKIVQWEKSTSYSTVFKVYTDAAFDGLEASPELNSELKKAGCKIRARKQRNMTAGPHGMVDLDGFRVNKKYTYDQGQLKYSFGNTTNHFGLDENLFNRPGTSLDLQMFQNIQNAQAAAQVAAVNMSNRTNNVFAVPSNLGLSMTTDNLPDHQHQQQPPSLVVQTNGLSPVKRPQTALPQIITSADQFSAGGNMSHSSYSDMLRSAIGSASEYGISPIEHSRRFNIQSAGPFNNNDQFSDLLANATTTPIKQIAGTSNDNSPSVKSSDGSFMSPMLFQGINMQTPSSASGTPVSMSNQIQQQLFNAYTMNNQYMLNMLMGNNNNKNNMNNPHLLFQPDQTSEPQANVVPQSIQQPQLVRPQPVSATTLGQPAQFNLNISGDGEVPRSTFKLDSIPMFWDNNTNISNNNSKKSSNQSQLSSSPEINSVKSEPIPQSNNQNINRQQSQHSSLSEETSNNDNNSVDENLFSNNSNNDSIPINQTLDTTDFFNFPEIYQHSEMLLKQNFSL